MLGGLFSVGGEVDSGELSEKLARFAVISPSSLSYIDEMAYVKLVTAVLDECPPSITASHPMNTFEPTRIVPGSARVGDILRPCCDPQVFPGAVKRVAVAMIHVITRRWVGDKPMKGYSLRRVLGDMSGGIPFISRRLRRPREVFDQIKVLITDQRN